MTHHRSALALRGRSAIAWTLLCFVVGQAVLAAWVLRRHTDIIDPDHNERLRRLQARVAESPRQPVVVMLGSSRAANGFRPQVILRDDPSRGLVFNFASLGCGPVRQWLTLRRILDSGIKPDLVLVETWPLFWPQTGFFGEEPFLLVTDVYRSDLAVLGQLYDKRWEAFVKLFGERVTPGIHYRAHVVQASARWLLPKDGCPELLVGHAGYVGLDDHGWLLGPTGPGVHHESKLAWDAKIATPILDRLAIDPHTDAAIHGLVADCRSHGIRVAFVFLPESSPLRQWYPPAARAAVADYLSHLERDCDAPVFNLRDWMPDDAFADYCHLTPQGAESFTARFDREVLRPLMGAAPSTSAGLPPR
jgi:hypothetical protein